MKSWQYLGLAATILGVATIIYINRREKARSRKPLTDAEISGIVAEVQADERAKYSDALLREYEVVLPTGIADKKVREKAEQITRKRYAVNPKKIRKPLMVNEL